MVASPHEALILKPGTLENTCDIYPHITYVAFRHRFLSRPCLRGNVMHTECGLCDEPSIGSSLQLDVYTPSTRGGSLDIGRSVFRQD